MKKIISINPLAEYIEASESRRTKIIEEQLNPDPIRIPYYQLAKARMKKSIALSGLLGPINEAIEVLKARKPKKLWQINDNINSIEALNKFKQMALNSIITTNELEIVKTKEKYFKYNGIEINVSPNLIFRVVIDGKKHIGACKIHVSKGKPFSNKQSKLVANIIEQFLSNCVAAEDEYVNPLLCFCLDPFAGTTINSNSRVSIDMKQLKAICDNIAARFDDLEKRKAA